MMTADFILTLTMNAILSESTATTGGRRSLGHVPGSALLGLVAQRYGDADHAWELFHSGAVRFSNAYPVIGGAPSLPVPLTWRTSKGAVAVDDDGILQVAEIVPDGTEKVSGYVTRSARIGTPRSARRARAAIDRDRGGQTLKGALFEDAAIAAGQRFWFRVSLDAEDWAGDALALIRDVFAQPGLRVGGGRNADYGGCTITPVDTTTAIDLALQGGGEGLRGATQFQLFAVSDLMLDDNGGSLTDELGLPGDWRVNAQHVRRREPFAPFNRHRGVFSLDRAPLVRGSVFTLCGETPLEDEVLMRLNERVAGGIGADRESGFGMVIAAPWLLSEEGSAPADAFIEGHTPFAASSMTASPPQDDPVWLWAAARARKGDEDIALDRWLEPTLTKLGMAYQVAQNEAAIIGKAVTDIAPAQSQWSGLRDPETGLDGIRAALVGLGRGKGVATDKWRGDEGYAFSAILADAFEDKALHNAGVSDDPAARDAFARRALRELATAAPRHFAREIAG